jgi:hypothetical protein
MGQIDRGEFVEAEPRFLSVMGLNDVVTLDNFELLSDLRCVDIGTWLMKCGPMWTPRKLADFIRAS